MTTRTITRLGSADSVLRSAPTSSGELERALRAGDYAFARGRIDVIEDGGLVRRCRFVHVPPRDELEVYEDDVTYVGDARTGQLRYSDGTTEPATSARAARDIPNWLLRPALAPIWGRDGDGWSLDATQLVLVDDHIRVPLQARRADLSDGFIDVVWPGAYLSHLSFGEDEYRLRELEWRPLRVRS
ncbi:MAG: hypothetical protein JO147_00865 [Actinobacteria bacterium]|nr:hypothetical protein [Actinomycetota bacterium]